MSRATPQLRNLAEALLACETKGPKTSQTHQRAAFLVCEKLRPHLANLVGSGGFRALLARALALASTEVPSLGRVKVKADGSLEGLDALELDVKLGSKKLVEGSIVLISHLLALLVAFIGEGLTLRLIREVWPKLSLNELDFRNGGKNEKAK